MDRYVYVALVMCLLLAGGLSLFASPDPDGLERVAEDGGFIEHGEGHETIASPFPDYVVLGIENETLAASLAGAIGVTISFTLVFLAGRVLVSKGSGG
ncbi:MAG: PDGLE domain-containing protein [Candidatus Micrarchaeota archaeon]